ncbi:YALIA101S03e13960g1_1 [Yarrowia lipolytica]|nr:YALIA101S03e13960g1_1 [Yarrowia lipolytica]
MSTFDGIIREFPEIRVDYFHDRGKKHPVRPEVWLLSHVHTDHTAGLENVGGLVYCSKVTKNMLVEKDPRSKRHKAYNDMAAIPNGTLKSKYTPIQDRLRGLDLDTPFEINVGAYTVSVTLLDASNHCPGAVMFLLQGKGKCVLYTGDIRAEKWWLRSLENHPLLLPYICGVKKLDCIYLDTTFGYRGEPYISLVDNNTGLGKLMKQLSRYPLTGSIQYFLPRYTSGFELIWQYLAAAYDWKVHMEEDELQRVSKVLQVEGRSHYIKYLTKEAAEATLHCCSCQRTSSSSVLLLPVVNYLASHVDEHNRPKKESELQLVGVKDLLRRLSEEYTSSNESHLSDVIDFESGQRFIKTECEQGLDLYLPDMLLFHYSRHSSYLECEELVGLFKPRSVFPCVVSKDSWQRGFSMARLFGHVCQEHVDQPSQFMYDVEMCIETARPIPRIREPVLTLKIDGKPAVSGPSQEANSQSLLVPKTVKSFQVRAPGTQNVKMLPTGVFNQTDAYVPASDSGNSDILDQLNLYKSPIRSPVRTKSSPGRVDHAVRPMLLPTTSVPSVKEEPQTPSFGEALSIPVPPVSFALPVQLATAPIPASTAMLTTTPMPSSSPGMPTSSPADAVMSSPFKKATSLSSMYEEMPEECESITESVVKVERDSDEFYVSVNSLPQLIARIIAEPISHTSQPTTQPELGSMVEQPERQNVSMTEQVEAKVAEFSKPMKDLVNQPQENTLSQRRISLHPEVPTAPRQPPRITGVLRQASLSRKPSVAHHSSPSPRSSKSPPPKNMCPEPSKIIMGPPVLRRTADDVYDICEKIGQCRLVRNKRKVHRPFKVDRWKVSPVSE